jgi:hypothetical protein
MPNQIPRPESRHPPGWQEDLNPNTMAGQNIGLAGAHPEVDARTAHDVKEAHRRLKDFDDDELRQIPILPRGSRLEQGATYVDLHAPAPVEFRATGDMEAAADNWFVPKNRVDHVLWNRLIGVDEPARIGQPDRNGD